MAKFFESIEERNREIDSVVAKSNNTIDTLAKAEKSLEKEELSKERENTASEIYNSKIEDTSQEINKIQAELKVLENKPFYIKLLPNYKLEKNNLNEKLIRLRNQYSCLKVKQNMASQGNDTVVENLARIKVAKKITNSKDFQKIKIETTKQRKIQRILGKQKTHVSLGRRLLVGWLSYQASSTLIDLTHKYIGGRAIEGIQQAVIPQLPGDKGLGLFDEKKEIALPEDINDANLDDPNITYFDPELAYMGAEQVLNNAPAVAEQCQENFKNLGEMDLMNSIGDKFKEDIPIFSASTNSEENNSFKPLQLEGLGDKEGIPITPLNLEKFNEMRSGAISGIKQELEKNGVDSKALESLDKAKNIEIQEDFNPEKLGEYMQQLENEGIEIQELSLPQLDQDLDLFPDFQDSLNIEPPEFDLNID